MSNNHTSGPGGEASSNNSSSFVSRRESRVNNITGALPIPGTAGIERDPGSFKLEEMILSLRELFEQDRQIASQPDATRCGICYLYYPVDQLHYREEGLYVCQHCERTLKNQKLSIIRKQQKL